MRQFKIVSADGCSTIVWARSFMEALDMARIHGCAVQLVVMFGLTLEAR